jgi:hypothetical protein
MKERTLSVTIELTTNQSAKETRERFKGLLAETLYNVRAIHVNVIDATKPKGIELKPQKRKVAK